MPYLALLILAQEQLDALSQFALHVRFCLFKTLRMNRDRGMLTDTLPAIFADQELAFDPQARCHL